MDVVSVILGAFAAGGLVALVGWLQRLLGSTATATAPATAPAPAEAIQTATEALVAEVEEDVGEIRAAAASDTPESDLADLFNRKLTPFPVAIIDEEEGQ